MGPESICLYGPVIGSTGVTVILVFFFILNRKIKSNPAAAMEETVIRNASINDDEINESRLAHGKGAS